MAQGRDKLFKQVLPFSILAAHLALHTVFGLIGWMEPFELFSLLLLGANAVLFVWTVRGSVGALEGIGAMLVIAGHALIGQHIAPDALTSGAILMVNILVLYVGFKVFKELSAVHCAAFVGSYFLLFLIFIVLTANAEALFLLSLFGLAATARDLRLLAYFWAIVLSFTVCQPYNWEALVISFFVLKIMFSAKGRIPSVTSMVFLGAGLALLFFVLLPVAVLLLGEYPQSIGNIIGQARIRNAIYITLITATISTVFLAAFCIPLAYAISRLKFFGKPLLLSLIDVPIVIPQSVAAMPFIMKSSIAAFDSVPHGLEIAARTLGASSFDSFKRVALPLAAKGLFLGAVLAWARAAGEFGALLFLAPYPETAPVAAYNRFASVGLVETAPLVTTLLLFSLAMFFLLQLVARTMRTMYQDEEP
jgi:molybdate/tungstate transport system permease protein